MQPTRSSESAQARTAPLIGAKIAVWFSCGAASAVAAKLTLNWFWDCDVRIVNNPVAEEDPDNLRFMRDVEAWLGVQIEQAVNSRYPTASAEDVWRRKNLMSTPKGAPCTVALKKEARQQWESANHVDWHVLGFTADERKRFERFALTERSNVLPVLIDAGFTKQDCFVILEAEGVKPPRVYALGYPNANCIGCVKATSPTYWNLVRRTHPEVFSRRVAQEIEITEKSKKNGPSLVRYQNKRIKLVDLPADAKGKPLKRMSVDCGIFCEEN